MSKNKHPSQPVSTSTAADLGESLESNASVVNEGEVIEGVNVQEEKPAIISEAQAQENEEEAEIIESTEFKKEDGSITLKNIREGVIKIGDYEVHPGQEIIIGPELLKNENLYRRINHGIATGVYEKL